jgi:hypothetical protein
MVTLAACGGGGGASKGSFCDAVKDAKKKGDTIDEAFTSGDPKKLDAVNAVVQNLASKAPSEIKDDAKQVADVFKKLIDATKSAGGDQTKLQEAYEKLQPDLDKVEAASNRLEDYSKQECGVSLNSDTGDTSDSSSSSKSSKSSSSKKSSSSSDDFSFDSESLDSYLSSLSSAFSDFSDFSPN